MVGKSTVRALALLTGIAGTAQAATTTTPTNATYRWGPRFGDDPVDSPTVVGGLTDVVTLDAGNTSSIVVDGSGNISTWRRTPRILLDSSVQMPRLAIELGLPKRLRREKDCQDFRSGWGGRMGKCTRRIALLSLGSAVFMTCSVLAGAISANAAPIHTGLSGVSSESTTTAAYRWGAWINNQNRVVGGAIDAPRAIAGIPGGAVQLAVSNSASYVLTSDGAVWAWGLGSFGQLGNGRTSNSFSTAVKVDIPAGVTITQLANPMPFDSGLAVDSTGHVWAWGHDGNSSMCLSSENLLTPTMVPDLSDVTVLTGQGNHSLFDDDGTVVGCGGNGFGELGDGTQTPSATPVAVEGLPDEAVTSLESSWHGSGALMADGDYYDWGFNAHGEMGIGTTKQAIKTAEKVVLPATAVQVFQGGSINVNGQSVALLSDGTVWAWGNGHAGQLGDGGNTYSDTPVQVSVPGGVSFVQVSSGGATSYAVDSTGKIWSWVIDKDGSLVDAMSSANALTHVRNPGGPFKYVTSTAINVAAY